MSRTETLYLVEVPDGDRRYIHRSMSPEKYVRFKQEYPDLVVYKVVVELPDRGKTEDVVVSATAEEVPPKVDS